MSRTIPGVLAAADRDPAGTWLRTWSHCAGRPQVSCGSAQAAGQPVPGPGHHLHRNGDPRTPVLFRIASEEELLGPHLRLLDAVGRVHPELLGRTLQSTAPVPAGRPCATSGSRGHPARFRAAGSGGRAASNALK